MSDIVRNTANTYMRNNFLGTFRKIISENDEVNGFIKTCLQDVEKQVKVTCTNAISEIVSENDKFKPIFDG